jgi:hypothetical protein
MAIRIMMLPGGAALPAGLALGASAADNPLGGDVRDLRVGMTVTGLPAKGCEKIFHDRRLILDTEPYRAAGQEGREYAGEARFEIYERAG